MSTLFAVHILASISRLSFTCNYTTSPSLPNILDVFPLVSNGALNMHTRIAMDTGVVCLGSACVPVLRCGQERCAWKCDGRNHMFMVGGTNGRKLCVDACPIVYVGC